MIGCIKAMIVSLPTSHYNIAGTRTAATAMLLRARRSFSAGLISLKCTRVAAHASGTTECATLVLMREYSTV